MRKDRRGRKAKKVEGCFFSRREGGRRAVVSEYADVNS
jgi:hypothetical protein